MKLLLQILLIILVISTISICMSKPTMHKTVMVYDSAYTLVPEKQVEVEKETIPIMQKTTEPIKTTQKTEQVVKKEVQNTPKIETKTVTSKIPTTKTSINTTKTVQSAVKQTTPVTKTQTVPTPVVVKTEQIVPKTEQVQTKTVTPQIKILTQQEENIAWNIWRSNLQNKIMQDTKLPILPTGVVFKFSFSVDKYGKISNLQTWSETPTYTPYAIQYIAPVIRSYQGRAILNFPEGTARTVTDVKGGWRISVNEKYSTPQDYNDIERVVK